MSEPWRSWLAAAVLRLGMTPEAFWALTLAEWRALTLAAAAPALRPMSRAELEALLALESETDNDQG
ncbi:MAG: phage tail assembly chaperone [Oceanicaulis sp.]